MPPVAGADLWACLVASWCLGALPPVHLRAVCFVRAMVVVVLLRGGRVIINCYGVPREQILVIIQVSVFSPDSRQTEKSNPDVSRRCQEPHTYFRRVRLPGRWWLAGALS